jgi:hypothetical protein
MKIKNILKKFSFPWYTSHDGKRNYIGFWIENPLATWWKARKYFKRPKISIHFFSKIRYNCPYINSKYVGKILEISIHDLMWKDKFNSPRHERNPYIWVCFFRKFGFSINFDVYYKDEFGIKQNGDTYYWEYLLEWLYYKEKKTLRCYSAWQYDSKLYRLRNKYGKAEDGSEDTFSPFKMIIPCVEMSLTKKGSKELKREIENG